MTTPRATAVALLAAVLLLTGGAPAQAGGEGGPDTPPPDPEPATAPVSTAPPTVSGDRVVDGRVVADSGGWDGGEHPAGALTYTYRWLRDGEPLRGAGDRRYRVRLADLGHRLSVRVVATDPEGDRGEAVSDPGRVGKGTLALRRRPAVTGTRRYTHALRADTGRWSRPPTEVRLRWQRDGRTLRGATSPRRRIAPEDVGHRLGVRVRVRRPGYRWATATSARGPVVAHRVGVRRSVSYHVETRGRITADLATFRREAAATLADPRGWRGAGVAFREVGSGGSFTLVLAEASTVPGFSSGCSATWSCRVGRYVIINQTRWQHASPAWNAGGRSLRDYRHMVVNHETGHWLGRGHASCPSPGALAPVMMQQSKGRDGCRFNPWPTLSEQSR